MEAPSSVNPFVDMGILKALYGVLRLLPPLRILNFKNSLRFYFEKRHPGFQAWQHKVLGFKSEPEERRTHKRLFL
jgi:hypothetical protein